MRGGNIDKLVDRYKNREIESLLDYKQFIRKGARAIVHKSEEVTTIIVEDGFVTLLGRRIPGFGAILESEIYSYAIPEIATYKMSIVLEGTEQILHSFTMQHHSYDDEVMDIFEVYMNHWAAPDKLIALLIMYIKNDVGFDFDFSKGLDGFLAEAVNHTKTDTLKRMAKQPEIIKLDDLCATIENELKMRGEIQNDGNN